MGQERAGLGCRKLRCVGQGKAEGNFRNIFNLEEGETSPEVAIDAESQVRIDKIHGLMKQETAENEGSAVSSDAASADTEPRSIIDGPSFRRAK